VREPGQSAEVYRKAREWAERTVAAYPLNVNYRTCLAAAQFRGDDYKSALANLQLAAVGSLVNQQDAVPAAYLLSMVQYRLAKTNDTAGRAQARRSFDRAEAAYRHLANQPLDLSDLRLEAADIVDSPRLRYELTAYDKSEQLKANPADVAARSLRANAYRQLGQNAEAEADYDAIIAAGTKSPQANHFRGHAREHQLKLAAALADYEAALGLTAESLRYDRAHLLNEIARIRLLGDTKLRDPAEAIRRAEQAVSLDPVLDVYSVTLGIAHYRGGNDKTALRVLQNTDDRKISAVQVVPLKHLFMAMAQYRLGQSAEARASYDKAVSDWGRLRVRGPEWIEYFNQSHAEAELLLGANPKSKGP
jgi:tetratricopeptide (TPR) repeat protein